MQRDPSLIDRAPIEPAAPAVEAGLQDDLAAGIADKLAAAELELKRLRGRSTPAFLGEVTDKLAAAELEVERMRTKMTVDDVRAAMLEGYSNRVFWFVVAYCVVVGVMLVASGWRAHTGFILSDAILGIIAGSTAVAVIGLIGMVITGLFGSSMRARSEP
jgi:hypothetical protein